MKPILLTPRARMPAKQMPEIIPKAALIFYMDLPK